MIVSALGVGIIFSLLFTELTGLLTGGLISAGYLAFFTYQPMRIAVTLVVAFLVYGFVLLLSRFIILFGRRRFAAAVLSSYILGWFCTFLLSGFFSPMDMDIRAVGYIIPGLIANDMLKQGILPTLLGTATVTIMARLFLELLTYIEVS